VAPYELPTDPDAEAFFETVGFGRNDDVVPSRQGVPIRIDLDGTDFETESAKFFEAGPPTDVQLARIRRLK
jgi:hypothetical protein